MSSRETGALDFGYSMSAFFGDINNDGHLDVYVSKVHSGQRWYGHSPSLQKYLLTSIREGTIREDFPIYRELYGLIGSEWHTLGEKWIRGNSLLLNDGTGRFRDVAEEARANPFGWYWVVGHARLRQRWPPGHLRGQRLDHRQDQGRPLTAVHSERGRAHQAVQVGRVLQG